MKTRAAIAWKAGAPLTIEEVDLEGPRAGEVPVSYTHLDVYKRQVSASHRAELRLSLIHI